MENSAEGGTFGHHRHHERDFVDSRDVDGKREEFMTNKAEIAKLSALLAEIIDQAIKQEPSVRDQYYERGRVIAKKIEELETRNKVLYQDIQRDGGTFTSRKSH